MQESFFEPLNNGIKQQMKKGRSYKSARNVIVIGSWTIIFLLLSWIAVLSVELVTISRWLLLSFVTLLIVLRLLYIRLANQLDGLMTLQVAQQEQINLLTAAVQINGNRASRIERIIRAAISPKKSDKTIH
jgi:hypothetical protein